ncbi:hypothetical protein [Pseudonocardia endophytica]|uniref:Uncharacterized protein n=1 Tax=Pseudonocardia endophytica TaxID=401976 RepID=A0A4R1HLC2_PSEEN|nr:hypothetical protein [Pseudonocardia endophytica]TCK20399.1 hypothetical protein EV378_4358 [Pseudonocardia endophytica]
MPMLDPLATFLMRVLAAGNDVEPAGALFKNPDAISDDQRAMVDELARRGRENGYITGDDRVSVTADGQQFLEDAGL